MALRGPNQVHSWIGRFLWRMSSHGRRGRRAWIGNFVVRWIDFESKALLVVRGYERLDFRERDRED